MGFLDKVKTQAEQAVKQGQDKLDTAQAKPPTVDPHTPGLPPMQAGPADTPPG